MDHNQITSAQARKLHARIAAMLGYFNRLRSRMKETGFPHDDQLLLKVGQQDAFGRFARGRQTASAALQ